MSLDQAQQLIEVCSQALRRHQPADHCWRGDTELPHLPAAPASIAASTALQAAACQAMTGRLPLMMVLLQSLAAAACSHISPSSKGAALASDITGDDT